MEYLTYIIIIVISFILGWYIREFVAVINIRQTFENTTALDLSKIQITIELKDDMVFVYERDSNTYLAHGDDAEHVEKILKEKFPGKMFAASAEDLLKLTK